MQNYKVYDLDQLQRVHFIGIGGAGMSALAYVLVKRGFAVSGSDMGSNHMTQKLADEGAVVYRGHAAEQAANVDAVVVSTAIHADNVELQEAQRRGLPVLHRSDVLAYLLNGAQGVAVAGAHGKTTTSAMLGCITTMAGADPTVVIGGELSLLDGNARNGDSPYVVAEADESDGSFLKFTPAVELITNIENDHLDHYGTEENIYKAFKQFVSQLKPGGKAVLCVDNAKLAQLATEAELQPGQELITYALEGSEAHYTAGNISYSTAGTSYDLYYQGQLLHRVELIVPGRHNVLNSLGAFAVAKAMGLQDEAILAALHAFPGAKRRFETKGRVNGIWVVDDYAHHPTEIAVTMLAAQQTKPQRLLCVFQPHRYTRTQLLFKEFCSCFKGCDQLVVTDVYAAGEAPIEGVNSKALAAGIKEATGQEAVYLPTLDQVEAYFAAQAQPGDLIMTIGAGDVFKAGEKLVRELENANK